MPEITRKMGPLAADHPLIMGTFDQDAGMNMVEVCPACRRPFEAGQYVTLVPLGPGADPESRDRARRGKAYNAVGLSVHWACATGEEE